MVGLEPKPLTDRNQQIWGWHTCIRSQQIWVSVGCFQRQMSFYPFIWNKYSSSFILLIHHQLTNWPKKTQKIRVFSSSIPKTSYDNCQLHCLMFNPKTTFSMDSFFGSGPPGLDCSGILATEMTHLGPLGTAVFGISFGCLRSYATIKEKSHFLECFLVWSWDAMALDIYYIYIIGNILEWYMGFIHIKVWNDIYIWYGIYVYGIYIYYTTTHISLYWLCLLSKVSMESPWWEFHSVWRMMIIVTSLSDGNFPNR